MMTQIMAVEFATLGVRVNAIAPGPIETPLVKEMHSAASWSEWISHVPQGRYGTPDELAGV
jgi:NAD(P)-dependent dehydrogenase (short-subunit alcohol dehydrogenase family)